MGQIPVLMGVIKHLQVYTHLDKVFTRKTKQITCVMGVSLGLVLISCKTCVIMHKTLFQCAFCAVSPCGSLRSSKFSFFRSCCASDSLIFTQNGLYSSYLTLNPSYLELNICKSTNFML